MAKMRFGIFMPPFNCPPTQNPTVSLQRNIETIQLMDRLDYDEAWVGEHHSAGTEIIADPLTFIAHVGAVTRRIKLGTGVVSLPYHNPLWLADRAILVDHLIRFQPSQGRLLASEKRARSMHAELDAKAVAASKVAQDTYDAKQANGH